MTDTKFLPIPPFDQNLDETIKSISSFEGSILEKSPEKLKRRYSALQNILAHIISNYWVHSEDEPESNIEFMGYRARITATEGGYFGWFEQPGKFHFDSPAFSEHAHIVAWTEELLMTHLIMDALVSV